MPADRLAAPAHAGPGAPTALVRPTYVEVDGRLVDVGVRARVVAAAGADDGREADLQEAELGAHEVVEVQALAGRSGAALARVPVRLPGADPAGDVGAAAALVHRGARVLVTRHVRPVRRTVDVLAAVLAARA